MIYSGVANTNSFCLDMPYQQNDGQTQNVVIHVQWDPGANLSRSVTVPGAISETVSDKTFLFRLTFPNLFPRRYSHANL